MTSLPRWAERTLTNKPPEAREHITALVNDILTTFQTVPNAYLAQEFCCGHQPSFAHASPEYAIGPSDAWARHIIDWTLRTSDTLPGSWYLDLQALPHMFRATLTAALEHNSEHPCWLVLTAGAVPSTATLRVIATPADIPRTEQFACAHVSAPRLLAEPTLLAQLLSQMTPHGLLVIHDYTQHPQLAQQVINQRQNGMPIPTPLEIPTGHVLMVAP